MGCVCKQHGWDQLCSITKLPVLFPDCCIESACELVCTSNTLAALLQHGCRRYGNLCVVREGGDLLEPDLSDTA